MTALTFSASGTRWTVSRSNAPSAFPGTLPPTATGAPGLLFRSAEGDQRFLPFAVAGLSVSLALETLSNEQLGQLAAQAVILR